MPTATAHVVWFRRDLRVHDHAPLADACAAALAEGGGSFVLPVFVLDGAAELAHGRWSGRLAGAAKLPGLPRVGPYRAAFLAECLEALDAELRARGSRLTIRRGEPAQVLEQLARRLRVGAGADFDVKLHFR